MVNKRAVAIWASIKRHWKAGVSTLGGVGVFKLIELVGKIDDTQKTGEWIVSAAQLLTAGPMGWSVLVILLVGTAWVSQDVWLPPIRQWWRHRNDPFSDPKIRAAATLFERHKDMKALTHDGGRWVKRLEGFQRQVVTVLHDYQDHWDTPPGWPKERTAYPREEWSAVGACMEERHPGDMDRSEDLYEQIGPDDWRIVEGNFEAARQYSAKLVGVLIREFEKPDWPRHPVSADTFMKRFRKFVPLQDAPTKPASLD